MSRVSKHRTGAFVLSVLLHVIVLGALTLIVVRLPSRLESIWIDFQSQTELPDEEFSMEAGTANIDTSVGDEQQVVITEKSRSLSPSG